MFQKPTILMCSPDHYGIEYEINPWMSRTRGADRLEACRQWQALYQLILDAGAAVQLLAPRPGLPDLVFTANAGMIWGPVVYVSRFRHAARAGETPVNEAWFRSVGFETRLPAEGIYFEGAGDALACGGALFVGYLMRSDVRAHEWLAAQLPCEVLPVQLVDPRFYHLDTCFCPLSPTQALWYPAAFDEYAQTAIQATVPQLIEVCQQEAEQFACNAVVIGRRVLLNSGCPRMQRDLESLGYSPHSTPLTEFLKAGGSAKCLTLRLDGEDSLTNRESTPPFGLSPPASACGVPTRPGPA